MRKSILVPGTKIQVFTQEGSSGEGATAMEKPNRTASSGKVGLVRRGGDSAITKAKVDFDCRVLSCSS